MNNLNHYHPTGYRDAKTYGGDLPWPQWPGVPSGLSSSSGLMQNRYYATAGPFPILPFFGELGAGPDAAMNQAKRQRAEVSYQQPRPCQSSRSFRL
jgi:cyclin-dependent kinase 8/11